MSTEKDPHWASLNEKGTLVGMRFLLATFQIGGRPLFRIFLLPVVVFYSLFNSLARSASLNYRLQMKVANPNFPDPKPWHTFQHIWSFAITLLDKLSVWKGKITLKDVDLHNGEIISELQKSGKGAVIFISHLGNFEVCKALSSNRLGLKLTVLLHTHHAQKFNRLLNSNSRESEIEFMQVSDLGVAQGMLLSERLSQGQFVAVSADRVSVDNPERMLLKPFLGRSAPFPVGPFVMAISLKVPVITVQCMRHSNGRYQIYFKQLSNGDAVPRAQRGQALNSLMDSYVENLEHHCIKEPWQWYNFYNFWSDTYSS